MTYVLDACALIAHIKTEAGSDIIDNLLNKAENREILLCMSIVNLIEVFYGFMTDLGADAAKEIVKTVRELPIKVIDQISESAFEATACFKSAYSISLADAFGLATAKSLGAKFVTCDHHELDAIESQIAVPLLWIR